MEKEPIIKVTNLVAKYGNRTVLDKISFAVNRGEIFMVVGGSGCGKTTLLNHMIGLLQPSAGDIFINGKSIVSSAENVRLGILRKIGVLYQSGALFGSMDLLHNIRFPLEELTDLPSEAIEEIAVNKLNMVGLGEFKYYMPAEVSGGMQKRAAIARAMVLDPKILFLDEPSSGLDPVIAAELDALIRDLAKILGITFIIISHNLASIFKIAERVILLDRGKIIAVGHPRQLKESSDPVVSNFFNCENLG